jgi:protein adenylyltransferase
VTRTLETLRWDNAFARLPPAFYQRVSPTPLPDPYLVAANPAAAELIGLDPAELHRPELLAAINGQQPLPGAEPVAAIYAGHQFGVWVPQLGDGRAILLGEVVNARHQRWDLQVKGSGLTGFSRMGDGRAVLRSTIREYLAGEAMHGLGIPTTRSLAIIGSDAPVYREKTETAAVLVRLAPTHIRFGSFELFASRGQHEEVRRLADHVIDLYFPRLLALPASERYVVWFREVVDRTARLIAQWTAVGFAHGVMNTDNMSIVGVTLDYGPYGWLDSYDRDFIPNHSDPAGRYAYSQQPLVGLWNSARLAEALLSLISRESALEALEGYRDTFESEIDSRMRAKLGLVTSEPADGKLLGDLFAVLQRTAADYTRFFRALSHYAPGDAPSRQAVRLEAGNDATVDDWLARYATRLLREASDDTARHQRMLATNPKFVLRNWLAQDAITRAEAGDYARIEELRQVLAAPFDEHSAREKFAQAPPEWARHLAVSCSS